MKGRTWLPVIVLCALVLLGLAPAKVPVRAEREQQTVSENLYSLRFDGHDDFVKSDAALTGQGPFAVAAWVKTTAAKNQVIIQQRSGLVFNGEYQLRVQASGKVLWLTFGDMQSGFTFESNRVVNDGNWHHVAAVREVDGTGRIYIDGLLDNSQSSPPRTLVSTDVYVGADMRDSQSYFKGSIDEVGVWRTALEPEEIAAVAAGTVVTRDLAAFWRFEDGTGALALDGSGNGKNATLDGPLWHIDVPFGVGEQDSYLAITHVSVWNSGDSAVTWPPGRAYTGVAWEWAPCTAPGKWVQASDVNANIEGTYARIWVMYDLVPRTASTPVLTGIAVREWPDWNVSCPSGYVNAGGGGGVPAPTGALTTRTKSGCYRSGLCVRYTPMNQTETFITNLSISYTDNDDAACPGLCGSNAGFWTMQSDVYDIHKGCGSGFMYLCYNEARHWPPMPTSFGPMDDTTKLGLLQAHAPRVWLANYEPGWPPGVHFYPSSVEWSFGHMLREWTCTGDDGCAWWLRTKEALDSPSDHDIRLFHGCDGISTDDPCTLAETPVYAFWDQVEIDVDGIGVAVGDLVYFTWYPYNRGKSIETFGTFGHHVGDWEHATVRLTQHYADGVWSLKPSQMYLSFHDRGVNLPWEALDKVVWKVWLPLTSAEGSAPTSLSAPARESDLQAVHTVGSDSLLGHPVVFAAWGSHGLWPTPGQHWYQRLWVPFPVDQYDYTGYGEAWDTWRLVEAYDFDRKVGLSSSLWPVWMSKNYRDPDVDGGYPGDGPIFRWGNTEWDCAELAGERFCRLDDSPTGPVDKGVWDSSILR